MASEGACLRPEWNQPTFRRQLGAHIEPPAFAVECLLEPNSIRTGCRNRLESPDLKGYQFEVGELPGQAIEAGKIHQGKIATEFLMPANAFIII